MKRPFPALAFLGFLSASCGPSPLLDDLQKEVAHLAEPIATPYIVPAGGAFRYSTPAVTITTSTPGARLFYTLNGSRPVYNSHGRPDWPNTNSTDQSSMGWPSLGSGTGMYPVKAVAWRDGVVSPEAMALFRVVGDGGVRWVQTGLGAPEGQVLALNRAQNGFNYGAGWVRKDLVTKQGFVARYDDNGSMVWFVPIGGTLTASSVTVTGVSSDSIGNVFITGNLSMAAADTFQFGGTNNIAASVPCGFLAEYNSGGACQWAVGIKSTVPVYCTGIAVASGNAYVSGWAEGSSVYLQTEDTGTAFGPIVMPSKSPSTGILSNAFVARYTTTGTPLSVFISNAAAGTDRFYAVAFNGSTVAIAGAIRAAPPSLATFNYRGDLNLQGDVDQWNAIVITTDMSFNVGTIKPRGITSGGVGDSQFNAVALASGSVVAGGFQKGTSARDWGNALGWSGFSPAENAILVGYDAAGSSRWVAGPVGASPSSANGLVLNTSQTMLFAGGRLGSGAFQWQAVDVSGFTAPALYPYPVWAPTDRSPFQAKLDPATGAAYWVRSDYPGSSDAETFAVAPGPTLPEGGTLFFGGTQVGSAGVDWGQGMKQGAPGPGNNPLVFQTYD